MSIGYNRRPRISVKDGIILHNDEACRVVMRPSLISIGCVDITPDAAKKILEYFAREFPEPSEVVVQA